MEKQNHKNVFKNRLITKVNPIDTFGGIMLMIRRYSIIIPVFLLTLLAVFPYAVQIESSTSHSTGPSAMLDTTINIDSPYQITDTLTMSEPVHIIGDDDADWETFDGDGSEESPYLIENRYIELNSSKSWFTGISIDGTTHHVIIQDCFITGMYEWAESDLLVRGTGILIRYSSNILITDNVFNLTAVAIHISGSENITITKNTILGNNIVNVDGYLVEGIHIDDESSNFSISQNTITNCNTALLLLFSQAGTISNNSITSCEVGLYSSFLTQSVISHNNISFNSREAMILVSSNDTLISRNTFNQNAYKGIAISSGHNNIISENIVRNTVSPEETQTGVGIRLDSDCGNNTVVWNSLIDNVINGHCDASHNLFDYNYYSDYSGLDSNGDLVGDTPYDIAGLGGIKDLHPRVSADARPVTISNSDNPTLLLVTTSVFVIAVVLIGVILKKR